MRTAIAQAAVVFVVLAASVGALAQDIPTIYLYVNDLTNPRILLESEFNDLQDLCYQIDSLSTAEVAILIVNTTQPWGIDTFAVNTFQANRIGKEGRDNGVLLVVSTDEHAWRFEVGYGLEGTLPDTFVGRVGRNNLTPAFQAGDFYDGIYNATYEVGTQIVNHYDAGPSNPFGLPKLWVPDWKTIAIVVVVFLGLSVITKGRSVVWLVSAFSFFKRGGFGGGRSGGGGASGEF